MRRSQLIVDLLRLLPLFLRCRTCPSHNGLHKQRTTMLLSIAYTHAPTTLTSRPTMSSKFREDFDTGRFTKFLFDLRIQEELPEWPPLHVQKRKSHRTRIILLLCLLIIILLFLIANVIFLNIRVLSVQTATPSSTPLSVNAQQCLSQYILNAPSSPPSYPCSTCLPILQAVPLSSNSQNAQQIINAIQFCGLRAIFDTANSQGQASLGWVNDVQFCAWNGVTCDSSGRVANLSVHSTKFAYSHSPTYRQLTFPGVPATLPNELGALTGLESLQVIGGNSIPGMSLRYIINTI
jgi:hypothetical protein